MNEIIAKLKAAAIAAMQRIPTEGQELLGLALLGFGLYLWSPIALLIVIGGLLAISALLKSSKPSDTNSK